MPYYFECLICHEQTEIEPWNVGRHEKNCEDCGIDGCEKCIPQDQCVDCKEAVDNPEGGV